jgi:hypothetical protein
LIKVLKAKALNITMAELPENVYDVALILDADNVLARDFITKINDSINGYVACGTRGIGFLKKQRCFRYVRCLR